MEPDARRVGKLLNAFAQFRRQNMMLATTWAQFTGDLKRMDGDSLGPIFQSPWPQPKNPLNLSRISISDLA